jgi:hypothetical protein
MPTGCATDAAAGRLLWWLPNTAPAPAPAQHPCSTTTATTTTTNQPVAMHSTLSATAAPQCPSKCLVTNTQCSVVCLSACSQAKTVCLALASKVGELKAAALQVVATIIMHSRHHPFQTLFADFVRKRAVRHLDESKKAYHSLQILRTIARGGHPPNDGALRGSSLVFNAPTRKVIADVLGKGVGAAFSQLVSEEADNSDDDFDFGGTDNNNSNNSSSNGGGARRSSSSVSSDSNHSGGMPGMGSLRAGHPRVDTDYVVTANLRMRRGLGTGQLTTAPNAAGHRSPQGVSLPKISLLTTCVR